VSALDGGFSQKVKDILNGSDEAAGGMAQNRYSKKNNKLTLRGLRNLLEGCWYRIGWVNLRSK
jgi:hypothetical protein